MCSLGSATATCSPKDIYVDSPKEQVSWLKKVRHSGEHSNVSIVVENQTFHLHMLPLMQESSHLKEVFSCRGISKDQPPGTDMAIKLDNFPGGAAIFARAMDFCYNIDVKFSTSNVAPLMAAGKYLGMDNLTKKAEEYLDRSVYKNWKNCLLLWAAIDQKDAFMFNGRLNEVMKKCERGFLECVATMNESSGNLWCNVRDVREMLTLSSPNLASRVFQTLVEARIGLYYASAESSDPAAACSTRMLLYQPSLHTCSPLHLDTSSARSPERLTWRSACEKRGCEAIQWLTSFPLPSEWQRAMFVRYIGEWMMQGMGRCAGEATAPFVLEGFLLCLLAEATKLISKSPTKQFPSELCSVVNRLKSFQSTWVVLRVDLKWLANTISRSELDYYGFEILQSIAKRISELHGNQSDGCIQRKSSSSKEIFKENIAKLDKLIKVGNPLLYADKAVSNFEESLLLQLKRDTLSVDEVLSLLRVFPPNLRTDHKSLYRTLEQVVKVRQLTPTELNDVNGILDYRMVSDDVVKSAFRHPKLGFSHSLLNRAMELEISKLDRVKVLYDQDDDCLSSREQLLRSRKCHLILEKALRTHMRASILLSERYRTLEEKVDALSRSSQQ